MERNTIMTPKQAEDMLVSIERTIRRSKQTDTVTKFQVAKLFAYVRKLIDYQVPEPPVDVSDDGHKFTCPSCKTAFDSEDTVEEFNLCYICGKRWK